MDTFWIYELLLYLPAILLLCIRRYYIYINKLVFIKYNPGKTQKCLCIINCLALAPFKVRHKLPDNYFQYYPKLFSPGKWRKLIALLVQKQTYPKIKDVLSDAVVKLDVDISLVTKITHPRFINFIEVCWNRGYRHFPPRSARRARGDVFRHMWNQL